MIREALIVCGLVLLCGLLGAHAVQHAATSVTHTITQFLDKAGQ